MLPNIFRKFSERQSILRSYVNDKNIFSTFRNNSNKFTKYKCSSISSELTKKDKYQFNSLLKNTQRFCTNIITVKKQNFVESESFISQNKKITDEDIEKLLNLDWSKITTQEFIDNFEKLILYMQQLENIPNINVDNILQGISELCSNFSTEEIISIFKYTCSLKSKENIFVDFKQKILLSFNQELLHRLSKLKLEEIFFLIRIYRSNKLARKVLFVIRGIFKIDRRVKYLSLEELCQLMNILGYCFNLPLNFYIIEDAIEKKNWDTFNETQIFNIVYGFLKNEYKIKNKDTRIQVYKLILNNINEMNPEYINPSLQYLILIYKIIDDVDEIIRKFFKSIEPKLEEYSLKNLINILGLASHTLIHEKTLINCILERFNKEMHNLTLPDIERISCNMTSFNYDSNHPFYINLLKELRNPDREEEISKHSRAFIRTLQSLVYVNIYPTDLISKIMDSEFIDKNYKNVHAMKSCHYFIDQSMSIECPNYTGHILNEKVRTFFSKKYKSHELTEFNLKNKITKDVIQMCERVFKNPVYMCKILPHFFNEDIIFCFDENDKLISPEPFLSPLQNGLIKHIPEEAKNYKWLTVIITNWKMIHKNSEDYSSLLAMKCRQLKALGYIPVVLSHQEWYLKANDENCEKYQEDYLKKLLNVK